MESPTSALKTLEGVENAVATVQKLDAKVREELAADAARGNEQETQGRVVAEVVESEKALDAARIEKLKALSITEMMYPMTNGLKEFGLDTNDQTLFDAWEGLFQSERKKEARAAFDKLVANLKDQPIPDEAMSSSGSERDVDVEDNPPDKPEAKKQKRDDM